VNLLLVDFDGKVFPFGSGFCFVLYLHLLHTGPFPLVNLVLEGFVKVWKVFY
jgi:hypothetical protein